MPTTLDYQTPPLPEQATGRAAFWGAFAAAGLLGAPFGDWVMESWYYQQHPDGTGFILSCICLIVIAGVLSAARGMAPARMKSPLIAVSCGLFGPLAGLILLCVLFL